ncbi:hypothetical protein GCM10029964_003870 [Kibdelosporangium lantanae]
MTVHFGVEVGDPALNAEQRPDRVRRRQQPPDHHHSLGDDQALPTRPVRPAVGGGEVPEIIQPGIPGIVHRCDKGHAADLPMYRNSVSWETPVRTNRTYAQRYPEVTYSTDLAPSRVDNCCVNVISPLVQPSRSEGEAAWEGT